MSFIRITDISKRFGATRALQGVSIAIDKGEVHGLLGENGAGKSTLMKVLSGVVTPDQGSVTVGEEPLRFGHPRESRESGIGIAFQELSSPPNITVAMKLCLRDIPRNALGMVSQRKLVARARAIVKDFGAEHIPVEAQIADVDLATRQQVEIIAAMRDARTLLVLDEPTAALPDTDWLFERMRELAGRGISIIYISHKLREIEETCDRATVIRNGRNVGDFTPGEISERQIVELMVGRSFEHAFPEKAPARTDAEPVVKVTELVAGKVDGVSFVIRPGEVLGVAALEGQGQHDLFYALAGLRPVESGHVQISRGAAARNTALVPEERKTEALFLGLDATFNLTISTPREYTTFGVISRRRETLLARSRAERVHMPQFMLDRPVWSLSGGNQQKAVIGRALSLNPACLILFDPTRGVDVPTKVQIYSMIRDFASAGNAVIMYSTEIPELVGACDRVLSMNAGRFTGEYDGVTATESNILTGALNLNDATKKKGQR